MPLTKRTKTKTLLAIVCLLITGLVISIEANLLAFKYEALVGGLTIMLVVALIIEAAKKHK